MSLAPKKLVLVGPTNVGKSALFNRLTRTRAAIVCDRPGVTVDRHELLVEDSPVGPLEVVDTGGVGPRALAHELGAEIERAASAAVQNADLIFFVVDGTREPGPEELEVASWLRRQSGVDNTQIWVIVNKCDSKRHDPNPYYSLGFDRLYSVSAEHDIGVLDLWDELKLALPGEGDTFSIHQSLSSEEAAQEEQDPKVIVLGRPNVGKSTLLNNILGTERHVVSEKAGTTRDPIETGFHYKGFHWRLVDTAGIRQPGRLERNVEWVAREKLKDTAKKADVAVIVMDASEGVTELDASIIGMAIDFGLGIVLAYNKWDRMTGEEAEDRYYNLQRGKDLKLDFIRWAPSVQISALTGKGLPELLRKVQLVLKNRAQRVQTSKLNRLFEHKLKHHSHPATQGRVARFYYMSQVSVSPPEFVLFSNIPGRMVHFSYRRFITNAIRAEFGFVGSPIKLHFKTTKELPAVSR